MRTAVPGGQLQFPTQAEERSASSTGGYPKRSGPLLATTTAESVKELGELELPGLTDELRWTWLALREEIAVEAARWGGSPTYFLPISWARWKELLGITSINAIKTRLARLEELGLIEVQPSECGPGGCSPNAFRLRVENEPPAFRAVMEARERTLTRKRKETVDRNSRATERMGPGVVAAWVHQLSGRSEAGTPPVYERVMADTPRTDTSGDTGKADTPSIHEIEWSTFVQIDSIEGIEIELNRFIKLNSIKEKNSINSINQFHLIDSIDVFDRLPIDGDGECMSWQSDNGLRYRDFNFLLKETDPEPWPDSLIRALGGILQSQSLPALEARSPWNAQGAWAILESIRVKGRNLGNQPGTLWNALVGRKNGEDWLAKILPLSGKAEGLRTSGDVAAVRTFKVPLQGRAQGAPEHVPAEPLPLRAAGAEISAYGLETRNPGEGVRAASGAAPIPAPRFRYRVGRPEEFNPMLKAQLRYAIEECRDALRYALKAPVAEKMEAFAAFSQVFQFIQALLEPMLPLQVRLPDQYTPIEIRDRSHIKLEVVKGIYGAIS